MINNIFTSGLDGSGGLNETAFFVLVIAIVWGWLLVSVFQRLVENLWFQTLDMEPRSTLHSLIIAVVMLFLFILFIWFIDSLQVIFVSAARTELAEAAGGLLSAANEDEEAASNVVTQQLGNTKNGHPIVLLNTGY